MPARSRRLTAVLATLTATAGLLVATPASPVTAAEASAPSDVVARPGQSSASVVWRIPAGDLSDVTGYRVTASPGGATVDTSGPTATTAVVGGLVNGTSYRMTVQALRSGTAGTASDASAPAVPYAVTDVADTSAYAPFVRALVDARVSAGCAGTSAGAVRYCPTDAVQRGDMAVFLARAKLGPAGAAALPAYSGGFVDVTAADYFSSYVRYLQDQRITSGCAADRYCPAAPVTRGDMAVFLALTELGREAFDALPAYTGGFSDVAPGDYFSRAVRWAKDTGVTAGCGDGAFCPRSPVTREQMAVFLVRSFGLPLAHERGPAVAEVQPTSGGTAGGEVVDVFGHRLGGATEVRFGAVPGTGLEVLGDGHLRVRTPAGTGSREVFVSTGEGPSAGPSGATFAYTDRPVLRGAEPAVGPLSGGGAVTLTGAGFDGTEQVLFGDVAVDQVEVGTDGRTLVVTAPPATTAGAVPLRVRRGSESSAPLSWTYSDAPQVEHVHPTTGPTAGGTPVRVTGHNLQGTTAVRIGTLEATDVVVGPDGTWVDAVTPAAPEGTVSAVSVTTPAGASTAVGPAGAVEFSHTDRPLLAYVSPSSGPVAGGTELTLHGERLQGTDQVLVGGVAATIVSAAGDGRTVVVRTPPATASGPVQVTATTPGRSARAAADPDATTFTYTSPSTSATRQRTTASLASLPYECQQVLFLGARGSGQEVLGSDKDSNTGMGAQVYSAYRRLDEELSGRRTVAAARVVFPAASVSKLAFSADEYFAGLQEGVDWTVRQISDRASRCSEERLVLAGYSQGAMVMHRVVNRLVSTSSPALRRVDGVLLLADGDRVAHDTAYRHGTGHAWRSGIGLQLRSQSGSATSRFPTWVGARVHSVCNAEDPVCDATGLLADLAYTKRHFDYVGTPAVHDAADAVARSVLSTPLPTPREVRADVIVGQPFATQLTADIDPDYELEWQVAVPWVLPPGITLTPDGRLAGTATTEPKGRTLLRVRGSILDVDGPWVGASVAWNAVAPPAPEPVSTYTADAARAAFPSGNTETRTSCVSATFCMATLGGGWVTVWDGARWNLQPRLPVDGHDFPYLQSLSCSSATRCTVFATGLSSSDGYVLRWDGTGWTAPAAVMPNGYSGRLSCPADDFCMLTSDARFTTWNGSAWSPVRAVADWSFGALSCAARTTCLALVEDWSSDRYAVWDGSGWSAPQQLAPQPRTDEGRVVPHTALSCPSVTRCVATAQYTTPDYVQHGLAHQWDGSAWTALPDPPGTVPAQSLSCAGSGFCAAAGNGTYATLADGTWSVVTSYDMGFGSVSCASPSACAATGDDGSSSSTMPGYRGRVWNGTSWSDTQAGIAPDSSRVRVSCSASTACMAVDGSWYSRWDGGDWSMPKRYFALGYGLGDYHYASHGVATSIDCAAADRCMVLGAGVFSTLWDGTSWTTPQHVRSNGEHASAVSCPTREYCVGGFVGQTSVYEWTGDWSASVATGVRLNDLDCATPQACFVVGDPPSEGGPTVSVGDGSTWTPTSVGSAWTSRISCAADGCLVVGTDGRDDHVHRTEGTSLRSIAVPTNGAGTVACASVAACINVDNYRASLWNGTSWSSLSAPSLSSTSFARDGFSCAPDGYCVGHEHNLDVLHSGRLS